MTSEIKLCDLMETCALCDKDEKIDIIAGGDMPGDRVSIHPDQILMAKKIFNGMLPKLREYTACNKKNKLVISVFGGSGSGKSGMASVLASIFLKRKIGCYVMSGDNYPRRVPSKNDEMRQFIYDNQGIAGLRKYLGGIDEIDYEAVNDSISRFKNGEKKISCRRMGQTADDIRYEEIRVDNVHVLILEWTHGNNPMLEGIDYSVYLHSTPKKTLARRKERNRDKNAGSEFIGLVLRLEQEMLEKQAKNADLIVDMDGTIFDYNAFIGKYYTVDMKPMLNAYPDSIGGSLSKLAEFFDKKSIRGVFSSLYLLPSLFHSDLDRGFSIVDYDINPALATEEDLQKITDSGIGLKLDFVLNHLSVHSPQFQDLLMKGKNSVYKDFFINWNDFWDGYGIMNNEGYIIPDDTFINKMFFRKPGLPILMIKMSDGEKIPYWNTFYQKVEVDKDGTVSYLGQMDLNIKSPLVWDFYKNVLRKLAGYGAKIVRLDAFAYAHKMQGEKNFLNEPGTWEVLEKIQDMADEHSLTLLPEIHAGYNEGIYDRLNEKGYMVYDFFLPGLIIDAIERKNGCEIKKWAEEIREKGIKTVNMLGCHDGIPLLDLKGLIPDSRIEELIDIIVKRGGYVKNLHGQKNVYYQVNATYYSALGEDDAKMLVARAIQLFMPGKPQIWYLDLFAGKNDYEAVKKAGQDGHKEINRTNIENAETDKLLAKPIVQKQLEMIRLRNTSDAFSENAVFHIDCTAEKLAIRWENEEAFAALSVDFKAMTYHVEHS